MKPIAFPGHELREQREELGLSVYEVFRKTRVPANYIEALERGDVQALPSACYTTGFLKTYCQCLGLDPDRYVDSFRACLRPSVTRFPGRERDQERGTPAWLQDVTTWAIVMAIVLLGWITYTVVIRPHPDDVDQRVQATTVDLTPPVPQDGRRF
jgi:cytoskeletal protein RodZ